MLPQTFSKKISLLFFATILAASNILAMEQPESKIEKSWREGTAIIDQFHESRLIDHNAAIASYKLAIKRAYPHFEMAAEQGHAGAANSLGKLYKVAFRDKKIFKEKAFQPKDGENFTAEELLEKSVYYYTIAINNGCLRSKKALHHLTQSMEISLTDDFAFLEA